MVVEFKSDAEFEQAGFYATIHFTLLQNKKCESWMDRNNRILQSPNYTNSYGSDIFCNYLITVRPNFHIKLDFHEFDVSFFNNSNMILQQVLEYQDKGVQKLQKIPIIEFSGSLHSTY